MKQKIYLKDLSKAQTKQVKQDTAVYYDEERDQDYVLAEESYSQLLSFIFDDSSSPFQFGEE